LKYPNPDNLPEDHPGLAKTGEIIEKNKGRLQVISADGMVSIRAIIPSGR